MEVNNLNELFNKFKEYRQTKSVANENNFYDYVDVCCSLQDGEIKSNF